MATQKLVAVEFPPLLAIKHFNFGNEFLGIVSHANNIDIAGYHPDNDPTNLKSQFVVVKATTEPGKSDGCFHLRSCYNNKYLMRSSQHGTYITARGVVRGEVYNTSECTLFQPFRDPVSGKTTVKFMVNGLEVADAQFPTGLIRHWYIRSSNLADFTEFEVVDLTPLKLPRVVSFKGDNGKFLQASKNPDDGLVYNVFDATDLAQPSVMYEVSDISLANNPYRVRIKSYFYDKFLRRAQDNWVLSDTPEVSGSESDNPDTVFRVDRSARGDNSVHLINLGNNKYCIRDGAGDRLNAGADNTAPAWAHLEVVEPVVSRTILVRLDDFRLGNAVIIEQETIDMDYKVVSNPDNVPRVVTMMLNFQRTSSGSWDNAEIVKWGGEAEFTSPIPQIISESEVAIEGDHQERYQWGKIVTRGTTPPIFRQVVVPPKTEVHVKLVAKKATCEVPFSYRQTDVLAFGLRRVYSKDDGRYTGTHVYDYNVVEDRKPISGPRDSNTT